MGKIVAIGGGTYDKNILIHKKIVALTGKPNPKALYIPTASGENENNINSKSKILILFSFMMGRAHRIVL